MWRLFEASGSLFFQQRLSSKVLLHHGCMPPPPFLSQKKRRLCSRSIQMKPLQKSRGLRYTGACTLALRGQIKTPDTGESVYMRNIGNKIKNRVLHGGADQCWCTGCARSLDGKVPAYWLRISIFMQCCNPCRCVNWKGARVSPDSVRGSGDFATSSRSARASLPNYPACKAMTCRRLVLSAGDFESFTSLSWQCWFLPCVCCLVQIRKKIRLRNNYYKWVICLLTFVQCAGLT